MESKYICYTLLVILSAGLGQSFVIPKASGIHDSSSDLTFLGRVGNKGIFMDNATRLNYWDAKTRAANLSTGVEFELLTLESQEEADFIRNIPIYSMPADFYWTAASDRRDILQFSWTPFAPEASPIFESYGFVLSGGMNPVHCLSIHSHSDDFKDFHPDSCDNSKHNLLLQIDMP